MRKWVMALFALLVISVGVAWGEGKSGKTHAACPDNPVCSCCGPSCSK